MTTEELRKKVAPIIVRKTLTQAAKLGRMTIDADEHRIVVRPPPAQQELPFKEHGQRKS